MFNLSSASRPVLALSSVSLATLLLASCGGGGGGQSPATETSPTQTSAPATGTVAGKSPSKSPAPAPATETTWTACATEGSVCSFSGTKNVRFGANGSYSYNTATDSIRCSDNDFTDPLPGVAKSCSFSDATSTTPAPAPAPVTEPAPAPGAETAPASAGPFGQNADAYTLSFSDEFNGSFSTSVWNDAIWYQSSNATKNYTVEDGKLKIWPQRDASGNFFNRTIDTDGKFYQTYGFFEIEAKLPYGKGTWPAFWLFNHDRGAPDRPEIDILEAYAGGGPNSGWSDANLRPTAYAATVWPTGIENGSAGHKTMQNLGDLSAGFHKYAVKWEPGKQTFYFDGKEVYTVNVSMSDRMYIILDLWFGSASGTPDNTTPTGKANSFEVNYVRAWKFK